MMTSNTLPHAPTMIQVGSQNSSAPKIPFESSKTMDECRIQVLRQFKKEINTNVRFSDVSETLISCGLVSKEECYEICKLSVAKQMLQCYQKVHDIMDILVYQKCMSSMNNDKEQQQSHLSKTEQASAMEEKQKELVKELWNNFISSLRKEHLHLASKMEDELDRITENKLLLKKKRSNNGGSVKLKKEDIGIPTDFKHVQHYGVINRSKLEQINRQLNAEPKHKDLKNEGKQTDITTEGKEENKPKASTFEESDSAILQKFFNNAGVAPRHLSNPVTRHIIYRFIAENGGMNAIRSEVRAAIPANNLPKDTPSVSIDEKVMMISTSSMKRGSTAEETETKNQQKEESSADVHSKINQIPLPATVPFQPTPKPTPSLVYGYF